MSNQYEEIAELVKQVSLQIHADHGVVCAVDCLLQWRDGKLNETIEAWRRYLNEREHCQSHTDTIRHGQWVPTIPLKGERQ